MSYVVLSFVFWQSLSSEVILENSKLPEGVTIAYTSRCKNGVTNKDENGRKCSNISIGDEVGSGKSSHIHIIQSFDKKNQELYKVEHLSCSTHGEPKSPRLPVGPLAEKIINGSQRVKKVIFWSTLSYILNHTYAVLGFK